MTMARGLRKFVLAAHITFAVSWLGAVASFFALAIAGMTSPDVQIILSAYLSMDFITRFVVVPLSFAPLITGPILSLWTPWGLFRHYWIIAKLIITILSTLILLIHIQSISYLSAQAARGALTNADYAIQVQMVVASGAALVALLIATALGVYKPKGMTPYGWRKQYEERIPPETRDPAI
ncbi:MAG: hypothetical protein L0Z71_17470 [Anaerolineae bacterium]|nr:hypothetical protein [Anaerolineae bacterium]